MSWPGSLFFYINIQHSLWYIVINPAHKIKKKPIQIYAFCILYVEKIERGSIVVLITAGERWESGWEDKRLWEERRVKEQGEKERRGKDRGRYKDEKRDWNRNRKKEETDVDVFVYCMCVVCVCWDWKQVDVCFQLWWCWQLWSTETDFTHWESHRAGKEGKAEDVNRLHLLTFTSSSHSYIHDALLKRVKTYV